MAKSSGANNQVVMPKKIPTKPTSAPARAKVGSGQDIRRPTSSSRLTTLEEIRAETDVVKAIRRLSSDEGFMSAAVFYIVQLASTGYKAVGYDQATGEFSQDVSNVARQVMMRMDTLTDYSKKFTKKQTVRAFIETALREVALSGAVAAELVLDKAGYPDYIQSVAYETLTFVSKGDDGVYPKQKPAAGGGEAIVLDIANFFVSELCLGADETYSTPMYKSALIGLFQNENFVNSMRRAVDRTGHSRLVVELDAAKVKASAPEDAQADEAKMLSYMVDVQTQITNALSQLSPEDAIVTYDIASIEVKDIGGSKADYVPLLNQLNNSQATSLKAPPSILGIRSEGSQSLANSETLVYLKIAKAIQGPVIDLMSRVLTLSVRLLGVQGYVKFEMEPIELRPESEREAYKMTKQQRILNLLSLGIYTDQQACLDLGVTYRSDMPQLSGTRFADKVSSTGVDYVDNQPDNTGGMEQTMNSDTPSKAGGESQ